ncbi:TPA: NAD(P)/FAD-dependent oxidoreductase [Thermoplasmata archaeon]|nr:NAD(P)/FAD-dependent oxidoreductase [Thermoplasmata archaeon]
MRSDVLVVGGGPAGSSAAMNLAPDHDVVIVEEHGTPGSPVQCAGLVTPRGVPKFASKSIISRVRGARIHSPLGFTLAIESKEPRAHVVDRRMFDSILFERAVMRGAIPITRSRVVSVVDSGDAVEARLGGDSEDRAISASVLVGADGHRSVCREAAGLRRPKHIVRGIQVDLKGLDKDPEFVDLYLGSKVAPGFFAWAIPAGELTRVGLCTWGEGNLPSTYLKKLLSRPEFAGAKAVAKSSGRIPIGAGRSASSGRIVLVGDAACHAKPLSGGGVFTGLRGAELSAGVVRSFLEDPEEHALSDYDPLWREAFGTELTRAFRIRKVFLTLTDRKMDQALRMFDEPDLRELIERTGDIDYPSALSKNVLKLAPKLAQFSPQLIKSLL